MPSVASVHARLTRDARPAPPWYGDDGERVELSGPVLAQWVTKTANLLVEELDAGPDGVGRAADHTGGHVWS